MLFAPESSPSSVSRNSNNPKGKNNHMSPKKRKIIRSRFWLSYDDTTTTSRFFVACPRRLQTRPVTTQEMRVSWSGAKTTYDRGDGQCCTACCNLSAAQPAFHVELEPTSDEQQQQCCTACFVDLFGSRASGSRRDAEGSPRICQCCTDWRA